MGWEMICEAPGASHRTLRFRRDLGWRSLTLALQSQTVACLVSKWSLALVYFLQPS